MTWRRRVAARRSTGGGWLTTAALLPPDPTSHNDHRSGPGPGDPRHAADLDFSGRAPPLTWFSVPTATVFEFDDIVVRFGELEVLRGVSFEIADGRITVLTGPSGSGKTTLLRLCNRLEIPTSGRLLYRGDDVMTLDPLSHRRRVGMVFQRPTLFAGTVRDNLRAATETTDAHYAEVLERVGLPRTHLDDQGDTLSGGEAQRACLARTLLTDPEVLLMDEPTSSLDERATACSKTWPRISSAKDSP